MIESLFFAPALAIAAQGHVFDRFSDAELCDVFQRNMTKVPPATAPITDMSLVADCGAKKLRGSVSLDLTDRSFDAYVEAFLAAARGGVCDPNNEALVVFQRRGWGFAYTFTAADGETVQRELTC